MDTLSEPDLRSFLRLDRAPLTELREDDQWLRLGAVEVSKKHPTFRVGFGHPVVPATHFALQPFDVDGRRGCAVVLHSGGKPPAYFAGWVPVGEEGTAQRWIDALNGALRHRLRTGAAGD